MSHRFLVKDIAFQAGLSTATVDRVINGRGGVRGQTASRVAAAVAELERQENNMARGGRTYTIDIVMEAPDRFSSEVRDAFEREAGAFFPNMFRQRFHYAEQMTYKAFVAKLDHIRLRGSDGVIIKAPNVAEVTAAVWRLTRAGVPVFTLVTDLPGSTRLAYAGLDNAAAGQTAAYLLNLMAGTDGAHVLVTQSSSHFRGEEERVAGFQAALTSFHPRLSMTLISEGYGRDEETGSLVYDALTANPEICAVYSVGGGNRAVLNAFAKARRTCRAFVAHDLDADNRDLLSKHAISFVLQHDLKSDVRGIYGMLLETTRNRSINTETSLSEIRIFTPFNLGAQ